MNQHSHHPAQAPSPDPLEAFVARHRAEFDQTRAPRSVWSAISADLDADDEHTAADEADPELASVKRLPGSHAKSPSSSNRLDQPLAGKVVTLYPLWRKLAVACMLLTIGVLAGLLFAERLDRGRFGELAAGGLGADDRPAQIEQGYRAQLDARMAELEALSPDSALRAELVSISQPDSRAARERGNFAAGNERLVIETMALEYQAKLEVLEHILTRLRAAEDLGRVRDARAQTPNEPALQRL